MAAKLNRAARKKANTIKAIHVSYCLTEQYSYRLWLSQIIIYSNNNIAVITIAGIFRNNYLNKWQLKNRNIYCQVHDFKKKGKKRVEVQKQTKQLFLSTSLFFEGRTRVRPRMFYLILGSDLC